MARRFKALLTILCLGALLPVQAQTVGARPEAIESSQLTTLLDTARTCLGAPYRRGGASLRGFDCSGLVHFVFDSAGIELSRSSRSQAQEGSPVARGDLLPGDLLFFKTGTRKAISHVGIYVGKGEFIHASFWGGPRNRCIRVGALASKYFADRLVAARRIVAPLATCEAGY